MGMQNLQGLSNNMSKYTSKSSRTTSESQKPLQNVQGGPASREIISCKKRSTGTIQFTMTDDLMPQTAFELRLTPSEAAILMYLHMRETKKMAPATREDIIIDTHLSDRTVDGAIAKLKRLGKIKRVVSYSPNGALKFTEQ
jgi:hypothetical protein